MTRPIDADALHVLFDEKCVGECESCTYYEDCKGHRYCGLIDLAPTIPLPDFKEGYKQAIRDGKTNYSRPQEWIPVNERLPEIGQVVIVTDDRGKVFEYKLDQSNMDKYTSGKWRFLDHKIIAWQPLPEPYKKEAKE